MTVSVIIVNWNTRALTCAAVRSVLDQEIDAELDVLVVDNGSTDDSVAALRSQFPAVRVIETGRNLGFARGNNVGLARARGEYTLLLNSDAALRPGALATLWTVQQQYPEAVALQPKLILPDGTVQFTWDYQPTILQELWLVLYQSKRVRSAAWQAMVQSWREPRRITAVGLPALWVPMRVWSRLGLLATEPFLFFEEADLSLRLKAAGPMYFVPAAEIEHHVGQSMKDVPYVKRRAHYRSRLWYYAVHQGRLANLLVRGFTRLRATVGLWQGGEAAAELWRPVLAALEERWR